MRINQGEKMRGKIFLILVKNVTKKQGEKS